MRLTKLFALGLISISLSFLIFADPSEDRLTAIATREKAFWDDCKKDRVWARSLSAEYELSKIDEDYIQFLTQNPQNLFGFILYGKFLNSIGQIEEAQRAFLKADIIDPKVAVVKQQFGRYAFYKRDYALALQHLLEAVTIEPFTGVYHYEIGEIAADYLKNSLHDSVYSRSELENVMIKAFSEAARWDSQNHLLALRLAEAYCSLSRPDWNAAFNALNNLKLTALSWVESQYIIFRLAEIKVNLRDYAQAKNYLDKIFAPQFELERRRLLQETGYL
jgi:tetratricopeptide (TPR) repeat protein